MGDRSRTEVASGLAGIPGIPGIPESVNDALQGSRSPDDALSEARQLSIRDKIQKFLGLDGGIKANQPASTTYTNRPTGFYSQPSGREQILNTLPIPTREQIGGPVKRMFAEFDARGGTDLLMDGARYAAGTLIPGASLVESGINMITNNPQDATPSAFDFGRKITADGYLGASSAVKRQQSGTTILKGALERYQQAAYAPYAQQIGQLQDQYGERIAALQQELNGYRGGLANINKAYSSYADDANAILSEAASVEAAALGESAVPETVQASYDEFDATMGETLARIDSSGNTELAKAMSEEVRYNEGVMVDALRSGLASQDQLHQLASSQAQALANMAWKDDLYNSELNRFQLELEIQSGIDAKAQEIQDTRTAMDKAIADTQSAYEQIRLSPQEVWGIAMNDLLTSKGFNAIEANDVLEKYNGIMENPDAAGNYESYKAQVTLRQNMEVIAQLGATEQVSAWIDANPDFMSTLSQGQLTEETLSILGIDTSSISGGIGSIYEGLQAETDTLLDLWGQQQDFNANPDKYMQVNPGAVMGGEVSYSADGGFAFPVVGFNWGSGGGFGTVRTDGRSDHAGVDIGAYRGSPIVSPVQGVVIKSREQGIGGWTVTIKAPDGTTHYLAHMDGPSTLKPGDTVNVGDYVGAVGSSGNAPSGNPMLHYGIRDASGRPINPAGILKSTGAWQIGDPPRDAGTGRPRSETTSSSSSERKISPGRV